MPLFVTIPLIWFLGALVFARILWVAALERKPVAEFDQDDKTALTVISALWPIVLIFLVFWAFFKILTMVVFMDLRHAKAKRSLKKTEKDLSNELED